MTRRSGKAAAQLYSSSATEEVCTPRTHLGRHLHLANNIHLKNHIHMQKKKDHNRMPDPWRASQLPALRRELTAVKKVKSLQDPSTSYHSFSPGTAFNSGAAGLDECRPSCNGGAHVDETVGRCKGREEAGEFVDRIRGPCHGERTDTDHVALAQWSDGHDHELFSTSCPRFAGSYRADERWHHGDATEIARRLISEQNGRKFSSPAHPSLARAHRLSLLGFRDDITNSETEGSSFPESEAELPALDHQHLSNSAAGSPLVIRGRRNRRRWKDASHGTNGNLNLRVRSPNSRARRPVTNGYKETRSIAGEELPQGEAELQPPAAREPPPASVIKTQCEDDEEAAQVSNSSVSYKYRPRSFKDMVGQTLVVKSLTTAITKGINQALPQVYLFAGPPGTGKTTCAGIFAAALVCRNVEPHRRPCGLCRECETLTCNRISRDVKEVDVGNSPDLDHIRSLLNLSLSSNYAHQRVFIVKGCDSLCTELCTSFLKLLYDLPRNDKCVFILITTDLERLPASATSRCRKYHFGKLKESEIVTRLQVLVEKEKLSVDEAALSLIASRAGGSLRDAESMLDQLSLLDQTITLSTVQELSGVIPDEKLVDLLDTALAADTANTVKGMRELLDAGIDALSLVAQLASLITNILAGAFDLQRETVRTKGAFFHRDMPRREQQQRLRQALKVLAECEKQLRASNDKPTWLAAALLQFAPDRSYLPSSVDTSKATSPIAFNTTFESQVPPGDQPSTPRLPPPQPSARKHSQKRSPNIDFTSRMQGQSLRDMEKASSPAGKTPWPPSGNHHKANLVRGDDRTAIGAALFDSSRVSNRGFRLLPRRDVDHIWDKVLDGCRSNALRQLLSSHGSLVTLSVASDETCAVALVEFRSSQHKARAERMRSSTCHAFQMALGCPVELKLSLVWSCPPFVALEDQPSDAQLCNIPPRSCSRHEMLTGLAARSRRLPGAGMSGRRRLSSHANTSDYKYCLPAAGSSRRSYRSRRRPSFTRLPSLESAKPGVRVRWKHPKFKGIPNTKHRNRKLKPRRKQTRRVALCWQSPLSEREQLPHQGQEPEHSRKVGFFLRMVPCGRPIWTQGSP